MVGTTIGKYRITSQLGRGGMGTVYRACDETLDREVALKVLNTELITPAGMQRFRTEAVTVARLNHPRIASIYELAREGDGFIMVMEYVAGETCEKLLARTGPLAVPRACAMCDQVLEALEHAHTAGIVHRDLKPANVMVTVTGDIKVMDFGIARVAGAEHLTNDGFMVGTPEYMAPEQIRSEEVDRRMDLYAVAVMLYRLLTVRMPFEADTLIALMHAQLSSEPTPIKQYRADLPDWIEDVIKRGMAKNRDDRFQTAAEFRAALHDGLAGSLTPTGGHYLSGDDQETIAVALTPPELRVTQDIHPTPKTIPVPALTAAATSGTVTLRKPQLFAASAVVLALAAGVVVLAYLALRRPAETIPLPAAETTAPIATPAAASEPPVPAAPEPTPPAVTTIPAAADTNAAKLPTAAPGAAATSAGAGATAVTAGANTPKPDAAAAARGTPPPAPPAKTPVPAAEATTAHAEPAPAPAVVVPSQSFGDIRTFVVEGNKSREQDALLSLESDKAVLRSRENGAVLQSVPYQSIGAATYVHAKRPRGKEDAALAQLPKDLGGGGFLKTSKHWLTLQSAGSFVVIRLDDKNVINVLQSLESRTHTKIDRLDDGDK
jgi:serine/threonine-protein kinase